MSQNVKRGVVISSHGQLAGRALMQTLAERFGHTVATPGAVFRSPGLGGGGAP